LHLLFFFFSAHDLQIWSFKESLNFWVFLLQLLSLFSKNSTFFLLNLFCLWALKFCFPLVLVCWNGFQLYCLSDLRNFISRISVWFFFLIFSMSLLNSSFISCTIFFISYITLKIFYSFIHMCIHCLDHFSPLTQPLFSPLNPPCFQVKPVLPLSLIFLKRRHKQ
jgi:hypothetical protein